ncbi:MAG: group II truncated hemoglobin [gamma proteobacterium symbiont of Clathrolucina costata]|uniref:Group II truncated hemoglobin n=1 Tax=Candidatus Thiodiazotropha taylori TaxID=2792791 RepID=A0A9E4TUE5_9GAMM|nr:group II truncated hemoglobin [Candidatus Thiodiazotropha sp. (ex Codakia orbicularis)]MBV2127407.1 group II truncated hemoglobin [Candidatus Thiodiazotropha taylori]MCG7864649.1 group II truncated hemoglobin [Candidatus Thiodiazotropha endolucinida]MCG7980334.1 group II truncated hemoglobin [Candidatus Thiodiazotropha taylori]MCW4238469.1 group II truncated hemoglobin [Candidatus Thiodiazotropha endolucinida]
MSQDQTPYERIGGEAAVRELVDRFYNLMDQQQEAKKIRDLHAKSLKISREKLFLFLSGWLGGPDLYVQKYGHPRLRARHLPFSIGIEERDQWIYCMRKALSAMDLDAKLQEELNQSFFRTADFMRNRDEEVQDTPFRIISSGKNQ